MINETMNTGDERRNLSGQRFPNRMSSIADCALFRTGRRDKSVVHKVVGRKNLELVLHTALVNGTPASMEVVAALLVGCPRPLLRADFDT